MEFARDEVLKYVKRVLNSSFRRFPINGRGKVVGDSLASWLADLGYLQSLRRTRYQPDMWTVLYSYISS